jgi:hypothetical protein
VHSLVERRNRQPLTTSTLFGTAERYVRGALSSTVRQRVEGPAPGLGVHGMKAEAELLEMGRITAGFTASSWVASSQRLRRRRDERPGELVVGWREPEIGVGGCTSPHPRRTGSSTRRR